MTVNEYEIELSFVRDGKQTSQTFTQWAYNVMEAVQQASFTGGSEDWSDMKIVKAGPPQRLIEMASRELNAHIASTMARLTKS